MENFADQGTHDDELDGESIATVPPLMMNHSSVGGRSKLIGLNLFLYDLLMRHTPIHSQLKMTAVASLQ